MKPVIKIKRAYEQPLRKDGFRVLVDRLWPRGLKIEFAGIDEWAKDLAPTTALREWFGHKPELWAAFEKSYKEELKKSEAVDIFAERHNDKKVITLIYAGSDERHTHALVLQEALTQYYNK